MIKKYDNYKPTGVEWVGVIPAHWDFSKYKFNISIMNGFPFKSELFDNENGFPIIRIRDITSGKTETFYNGEYNNDFIVKKDDVIIGMDGDFNIRWWESGDALLNQRCCKIINKENRINLRFLYYALPFDLKIINDLTYFTTVKHLSNGDINNRYLSVPTLFEQSQIARYLDYQTSLIDEIINRKEKQIELLKEKRQAIINETVTKGLNPNAKMRDSGIEWLGEIPEGWKISYLKRFCSKITDGAHFSPKTEFEGRNYISVKDVDEYGKIDLENCKKISQTDFDDLVKNGCQPQVNDVLLTKDGTIGRAAVVEVSNDFVALSSLGIITPFFGILDSYYLRYFLISGINVSQMYSLIAGAALTRLTIEKIKHLIITIPPIDEQKDIVLKLNNQVKKFDELINVVSVQIEKLKEYRQSIISEAVTGKIDLRDWQPNNA